MSHAIDSKAAQAQLIDPFTAPEPSAADGPGSHFGSTFAPASQINGVTDAPTSTSTTTSTSNNPYRNPSIRSEKPPKGGSPSEKFPDYRADAFSDYAQTSRRRAASHTQQGTPPSYQEATSPQSSPRHSRRRGSSLKERYPGDQSAQPLDIIRRDSKKAYRSPHLNKRSMPGADSIDRLDPAIGGRAYHHEGPYDATLLSRNRDPKTAPLMALETSNEEALKATPRENIKDAVERHRPLEGVADVPPGVRDRLGRTYDYEEGEDLQHENGPVGGLIGHYRDYDEEEEVNRALRAHKIDDAQDGGIEMQNHPTHARNVDGKRRPVESERDAHEEAPQASSSTADAGGMRKSGLGSLRKRIGSLKKKDRAE